MEDLQKVLEGIASIQSSLKQLQQGQQLLRAEVQFLKEKLFPPSEKFGNKSLPEILVDITSEISQLKSQPLQEPSMLDETVSLSNTLVLPNSYKSQRGENVPITIKEIVAPQSPPVQANTFKEEEELLEEKLQNIMSSQQLSKTVTWSEIQRHYADGVADESVKVLLLLSNYLSVPLIKMRMFTYANIYRYASSRIKGNQQETIFVQQQQIGGFMICYQIKGSSNCLRIACKYLSSGNISVLIALVPQTLPFPRRTEELDAQFKRYYSLEEHRSDAKYAVCAAHSDEFLVVRLGRFIAKISGHFYGSRASVYVDLVEDERKDSLQTLLSAHCFGLSFSNVVQPDRGGLEEIQNEICVFDKSCVVDIINLLSIPLTKGSEEPSQAASHLPIPPRIAPMHRKLISNAASQNLGGLFNYEIDSTDLQLVVSYNIKDEEVNSFAMALIPLDVAIQKDFRVDFNFQTRWEERPDRKCFQVMKELSSGVVERRNIRIWACMSSDKHANLKIVAYAI